MILTLIPSSKRKNISTIKKSRLILSTKRVKNNTAKKVISTYDDRMEYVKKDGINLQYIVPSERKARLCLVAVRNNPYALQFVPDKIQNHEIVIAAVRRNGMCLQFAKYTDEDIYITAVKQNGNAIQFIKKKDRTEEICLAAVHQNPSTVRYAGYKYEKAVKTIL